MLQGWLLQFSSKIMNKIKISFQVLTYILFIRVFTPAICGPFIYVPESQNKFSLWHNVVQVNTFEGLIIKSNCAPRRKSVDSSTASTFDVQNLSPTAIGLNKKFSSLDLHYICSIYSLQVSYSLLRPMCKVE